MLTFLIQFKTEYEINNLINYISICIYYRYYIINTDITGITDKRSSLRLSVKTKSCRRFLSLIRRNRKGKGWKAMFLCTAQSKKRRYNKSPGNASDVSCSFPVSYLERKRKERRERERIYSHSKSLSIAKVTQSQQSSTSYHI